jgi:ABC-type nitrate/sulfonate/bicarbonate transport system permease component
MSIWNSTKKNFSGIFLLLLLVLLLMYSMETGFRELLATEISGDLLVNDIISSFLRVTLATLAAWISGIIIGYLMYNFKVLFDLLIVAVNFVRHISPFAWLPFAIIWFGLGEAPISFILFITLFFPTLIAAMSTLAGIPREFLEEAQVLGASRYQIFRKIQLPLALKDLINTLRIIWGLGWTTIIAVEMLGVNNGLGFRLLDFRYLMNYSAMIIYIIIMGTIGVIVDFLLRKLIARIS